MGRGLDEACCCTRVFGVWSMRWYPVGLVCFACVSYVHTFTHILVPTHHSSHRVTVRTSCRTTPSGIYDLDGATDRRNHKTVFKQRYATLLQPRVLEEYAYDLHASSKASPNIETGGVTDFLRRCSFIQSALCTFHIRLQLFVQSLRFRGIFSRLFRSIFGNLHNPGQRLFSAQSRWRTYAICSHSVEYLSR